MTLEKNEGTVTGAGRRSGGSRLQSPRAWRRASGRRTGGAGSPTSGLPAARARDLREICGLPTGAALHRAVPFLEGLVEDPALLEGGMLPLLGEAADAENWYVARRHENEDFSLQVFVWPAGTGTKVHDHSSWGVYRCVAGSLLEKRYARLDDGSRPDHARLEKAWQRRWTPEDGASTVLPGDGGIHSMTNLGDETAVSIHLYGPRTAEIDGRDYDPSRDYVCDRTEGSEEAEGQSRAA